MISDDEYLERLVAAVHTATSGDADVRWNEKLNGRQFDVTVRFTLGTLRYLVVVEVKNRKRPTSASDVEAFVTKARDNLADKAVFVNIAGYQDGALTIARRHNVWLYTVSFDNNVLAVPQKASLLVRENLDYEGPRIPELNISDSHLIAAIDRVVLVYADGSKSEIPSEPSQMNYYMRRTRLGEENSLAELVESNPIWDLKEGQRIKFSKSFDSPQQLVAPDDYFFPIGKVSRVDWEAVGAKARRISGNVKIDPTVFSSPVIYTNVLTNESISFPPGTLPLGDGNIVVGNFYFSYNPLIYYHCDGIVGDIVKWTMVESFQSGDLIRARFTQDIRWTRGYLEVRDNKTTERLRRRLSDYEMRVSSDAKQMPES